MLFLSSATNTFPMLYEPGSSEFNLQEAVSNRNEIEAKLLEHGALLFRDVGINTLDDFQQLITSIFPDVLSYNERSSPRTRLTDKIYTSTDYPANRQILLHNESSYSTTWPSKICFYCLSEASEQGETPIADVRKVYKRIDPKIRERFMQKGWMLVRNYSEGVGLTWQTAFQTSDRREVETLCQ